MTRNEDFHVGYAAALHTYLETRGEQSLAVGNELGRQALQGDISMLEIIEKHLQLVEDLPRHAGFDAAAALAFLLQTLAPLDVATRGFLPGTKRYEEQRARAEDLADRDEFRNAVVNSLQEGFFVADRTGAVIEVNDAFTKLTGYPARGLPYQWPHPWLVDEKAARLQQSRLSQKNAIQYETPIRHRDGRLVWVTANINHVNTDSADGDVYVGTIRDITAERAFAARESAVLRLATAVSVAKSLSGSPLDHPRRMPTRARRSPGGGRRMADERRRSGHPGGRRQDPVGLAATRSGAAGNLSTSAPPTAAHGSAN